MAGRRRRLDLGMLEFHSAESRSRTNVRINRPYDKY
jgi:hypothetical protein